MTSVIKPIVYISNTWVNKQKSDGSWERIIVDKGN